MLALLEAEQEDARFSSGRTPSGDRDRPQVEQPVAKINFMSQEERKALVDKREQEIVEKREKEVRFTNRKSFDEILQKLLNGDIFDLFADKQSFFPQAPLCYQGHWEYLEVWEHLFTYEVYNMLLNSRRSDSKDEKPNMAGHEGKGGVNAKKQLMFVGYSVLGQDYQGLFQPVRIYKNPPFSKNINATDE